MDHTMESRFVEFVHAASEFVQSYSQPTCDDRLVDFTKVCEAGKLAILAPVKQRLCDLRLRIKPLCDVLSQPQDDLLDIANVTYAEDPYTELIAWTLDPRSNRTRGVATQKTWLESLGIAYDETCEPAIPETQVYIEGEIPDLLLNYANRLIVVEAKTGTTEHTTVTREYQTVSYPKAARRHYGLSNDHSTEVIYLTVDRSAARSAKAKCTSYVQFALVLAEVASMNILTPSDSWAFRLIARHFACQAVPGHVNTTDIFRELEAADLSDAKLLRNVAAIQNLDKLLETPS